MGRHVSLKEDSDTDEGDEQHIVKGGCLCQSCAVFVLPWLRWLLCPHNILHVFMYSSGVCACFRGVSAARGEPFSTAQVFLMRHTETLGDRGVAAVQRVL